MKTRVIVVKTGTANLASIAAALRRLDAEPVISDSADEVKSADRLVLPGVGTLGAAMQRLQSAGLVEVLRERITSGLPTLAVCLGLHLLCSESEESPGCEGLSIIDTKIKRFDKNLKVPQMGWNNIKADEKCSLLKSGYAYFANSYYLKKAPLAWAAAYSDYGGPFVAAMEKGYVMACQFHPELSGTFGLELISRWLKSTS